MAAEMILVPMEQWNRATKGAKDYNMIETLKEVKMLPKDTKERKEMQQEYKTLLKELNNLKQGLTTLQQRDGHLPSKTKGTGREKSRKRKQAVKMPPPGIPHNRTPLAKETKTRDLSKRPPYIKNWSYD